MENDAMKGYNPITKRWSPYKDKDVNGVEGINFGAGINKWSDVGSTLNYDSTYTTKELNDAMRPDLLKKMDTINHQLREKYGRAADTMSIGNKMILLDIAHNVRPNGQNGKDGNMPKGWPKLTKAMMNGDYKTASQNTLSSKDTARQRLRNQMLFKKVIDKNTVKR